MFVGHLICQIHIHDCQCHKDVCLQCNNQNMENSPAKLQETTEKAERPAAAIHDSDKDENHFTRKHVAV